MGIEREEIELSEDIVCYECFCWLCEHEGDCPVDGCWQQCPVNDAMEHEY